MRGNLNGGTFETPDGHTYYKRKHDALKSKLYFRCKKYSKGCKAVLHTDYTECDNNDLKVIFKTGEHNHGYNHKSSECGAGRGRKRRYARVESDEEDSEHEEDSEGDDGDDYDEESDDGEDSEVDDGEEEEADEKEKDGDDVIAQA